MTRKAFRKILTDAAFVAISGALIGGTGYWAALQWLEVADPSHIPYTITTEHHYIVFVP
jgi:hypothetical protein